MMQAETFGSGADVTAPDRKTKEGGRLCERLTADFLAAQMGACIPSADHPLVLSNAAGGEIEWCDLDGDQRLPYDLVIR